TDYGEESASSRGTFACDHRHANRGDAAVRRSRLMKRGERRWASRRWSSAAGLLCALAAGLLAQTDLVERWELRTQDRRFAQRGPRTTRARIVIAAIADSTLA